MRFAFAKFSTTLLPDEAILSDAKSARVVRLQNSSD